MTKDNEIPEACGVFVVPMNFGQFTLKPFSTLNEKMMSEEEIDHYEALVEGISYMIAENAQFLVSLGQILIERMEDQIEFEADEELVNAINESKIIPFKN